MCLVCLEKKQIQIKKQKYNKFLLDKIELINQQIVKCKVKYNPL